jgi:hypothetical protein
MDRNEPHDRPLNELSLADLERAVLALKPATICLSRDRLMFLAGRASAEAERECSKPSLRRSLRLWRAGTAVASLAAVGFALAAFAPAVWRLVKSRVAGAGALRSPGSVTTEGSQEHRLGNPAPNPSQVFAQPTAVARSQPASATTAASGTERITKNEVSNFAAPAPGQPLNYLQMRDIVRRKGVDALPSSPPIEVAASPPLSQRELLDELLETVSDPSRNMEELKSDWGPLPESGENL